MAGRNSRDNDRNTTPPATISQTEPVVELITINVEPMMLIAITENYSKSPHALTAKLKQLEKFTEKPNNKS